MKSDDDDRSDSTDEVPAATRDDRVTITGADRARDAAPWVDEETLLPHWTDAPTGQVPVVVARDSAPSDDPWAQIPAPAWREGEADWVAHEDQFDASFLASERESADTRPWEFADEAAVEEVALAPEPLRPEPRASVRRPAPANPLAGRAVRQRPEGSMSLATLTGVLLALVVVAVFIAGPMPVAVLCLVALGLAAGEAFAGLRQVGAHPATILGIVAVLTLGVAVYNKGAAAIGAVSVLTVVFGFLWYLFSQQRVDVLDGMGATLFVYSWVGILGSYALLMVEPHTYAHRHGLAYLFGAIVLTVANDTGALFIGRALGKRPLNASLSPNKTIAGTVGGTIVTLLIGGAILPLMSPWTHHSGLEVAAALCVVVPLGDLFESMVKRSLGVKDLGRVLPGHGGLLDRIDGLLFALPATYYLLHVLKLG